MKRLWAGKVNPITTHNYLISLDLIVKIAKNHALIISVRAIWSLVFGELPTAAGHQQSYTVQSRDLLA